MLSNSGVKNGLLYGGIAVATNMILYFIDPTLLLKFYITIPLGIALITFFCIKAGKEERNLDSDGLLSYGDAYITMLITVVIGSIMFVFWEYVLYSFIWSDYEEIIKAETIKTMEGFAGMISDEAIPQDAIDEINKQDFSYGVGTAVISWLSSTIMGAIYALILAIFVKRTS